MRKVPSARVKPPPTSEESDARIATDAAFIGWFVRAFSTVPAIRPGACGAAAIPPAGGPPRGAPPGGGPPCASAVPPSQAHANAIVNIVIVGLVIAWLRSI